MAAIGALRQRKPLVCMLSGLAFYLLYRWDLGEEPFPDFGQRPAVSPLVRHAADQKAGTGDGGAGK
jgi:hypothetical protein